MIDEWMLEQLQRERYLEVLREAEHGMLFHRVIIAGRRNSMSGRILIWLGRVLASRGQSLLARYDTRPDTCLACTLPCCEH